MHSQTLQVWKPQTSGVTKWQLSFTAYISFNPESTGVRFWSQPQAVEARTFHWSQSRVDFDNSLTEVMMTKINMFFCSIDNRQDCLDYRCPSDRSVPCDVQVNTS